MNICQPKYEKGTCNKYINGCDIKKNIKVFIAASIGLSQFKIIISANNIQLSKYVPKLAREVCTVNGSIKNNAVKKAVIIANSTTLLYVILVLNSILFNIVKLFNDTYTTRCAKSCSSSFVKL